MHCDRISQARPGADAATAMEDAAVAEHRVLAHEAAAVDEAVPADPHPWPDLRSATHLRPRTNHRLATHRGSTVQHALLAYVGAALNPRTAVDLRTSPDSRPCADEGAAVDTRAWLHNRSWRDHRAWVDRPRLRTVRQLRGGHRAVEVMRHVPVQGSHATVHRVRDAVQCCDLRHDARPQAT
eukprot:CAMPEP_0176116648 /NCGR_PEP_ID=MMETSP0120_2-20121206/58592_1 /TAXON_ID=160619 /ORGANISM="Kryptoperidinium foliaceum, Strain CCMP 1326" /LENGTH=181 /DNA_ID=CAMNT_0017450917 /DNA_START=9 /DNA_END=551 /DNA_ORIENTATION=-